MPECKNDNQILLIEWNCLNSFVQDCSSLSTTLLQPYQITRIGLDDEKTKNVMFLLNSRLYAPLLGMCVLVTKQWKAL